MNDEEVSIKCYEDFINLAKILSFTQFLGYLHVLGKHLFLSSLNDENAEMMRKIYDEMMELTICRLLLIKEEYLKNQGGQHE